MAENIGLLYPIYLDISMMVSFVATIEGGYSLENVWKQSKDLSGDLSSEVEGEAGLPDILSTFVKASLKGSGSVEGKLARSEESQIVLRHTEASMLLKHEGKWKKSAVLDLSTKVLPLEEQELLRCGRVVVLGKATRVLTRNENINLYRRSILGYATQDLLI